MCSDERTCAVMKGCFCSDEYRVRVKKVQKYMYMYLVLRTKKRSSEFVMDEKDNEGKIMGFVV